MQAQVFDGTHTLIIGQAQRGDDKLQGAATMVLPASLARPAEADPVNDPAKRAEIAALESEIDIASVRLAEQVERLIGEVFPSGLPAEAATLHTYIIEAQKAEEQRGLRLAMLQEQMQQQLQRLDQQRQALRQRILSLSERLQLEPGLVEAERQQLLRSIEES